MVTKKMLIAVYERSISRLEKEVEELKIENKKIEKRIEGNEKYLSQQREEKEWVERNWDTDLEKMNNNNEEKTALIFSPNQTS